MEISSLHFECLDSTNTWSKENYKSFDPQKLSVVIADQQTAGRGRYKRQWLSPAGQNIYATFTFFLEKERKDIGNLTQILALAAVYTLEKLGFHPQLKWPNDIQINRKKVGGILCETIAEENHLVIVIGIGLNINMPVELLQLIEQPATSLKAESNTHFQITEVFQILQNYFVQHLDQFLQKGFLPFFEAYSKFIVHKPGDILNVNAQKGSFQAINSDGALIIHLQDGREQKIYSGELT